MPDEQPRITKEQSAAAEALIGLDFTDDEREMMLEGLGWRLGGYRELRQVSLPNSVPPALLFDPRPPGFTPPINAAPLAPAPVERVEAPANLEDVAFWPITKLAWLIESRQVTSLALTRMYLARLKRYDPILHCVVTLMEEQALAQARRADAEIAQGHYRGPLHGIPWGAKDLFATKGARTTWGAEPYQEQAFEEDATVVERLAEAGAVLVAKLALGARAQGAVWFGGMTRNPWKPAEGSGGSSAGSGAATAAGLVGFALGTETWGSIITPAARCGVTGLRPTFGRVSRHGAMALSWSMDKIGPMCRSVEDCALVFAAIYGPDGRDHAVVDLPFAWGGAGSVSGMRIGYVRAAFDEEHEHKALDEAALEVLRALGADLVPITLPDYPLGPLGIILQAEAAAAFDDLTRSNRDDQLARQEKDAWPNNFRMSRFIPAVEYIQANRVRTLLIEAMQKVMEQVDVYIAPAFHEDNTLLTNLTGHPAVIVPHGLKPEGTPHGITFVGRLYDEETLLRVAKAYQDATDYHLRYPALEESAEPGKS
jgi:Asp-tRNA(Asn)/Glu-tRNA(Gln) amidotransferase A subunit family amidase